MGRKEHLSDVAQGVWVVVLLGAGVLILLSLVSFHPQQVGWEAGGSIRHNYIGPVGKWIAGGFLGMFGVAAWLVPFLMLLWAIALLMNPQACSGKRIFCGGLLVVSVSCLLGLQPWFFNGARADYVFGAGGATAYFLVEKTSAHLIGRPGAAILFLVLYAIGMIVVINRFPGGDRFRLLISWVFEKIRQLMRSGGANENVRSSQQGNLYKPPAPVIRDTTVQPLKAPKSGAADAKARNKDDKTSEEKPPLPEVPEPKFLDVAAKPPLPKPPLKKKSAKETADQPVGVVSFGDYRLPTPELLSIPPADRPTVSKEDLMRTAEVLCSTLNDFDIPVQMGDVTRGPTFTRFEVHPAPGVKIERIINLQTNIAAAMKAGNVNIVAPVPGKGTVGIEVPNSASLIVYAREMFESEIWHNAATATGEKAPKIPLALGRDVYGEPVMADLSAMPHLLIAGSTGSGKSVCLNSLVTSMLFKHSPSDMRFVMIDPKVVELQVYSTLPHLAVPVVTDPKKVIFALRWVINEMERRYQCFAKVGVRNIASFNGRPKKTVAPPETELPLEEKDKKDAKPAGEEAEQRIEVPRDDELFIPEKFPFIVVLVDELADLMLVAPADVEMAIARITQMGRAAGIHMIVATQRPSVDVITGVIKSNISSRIAFQVAAQVDSRTILDTKGADKLLGKGDMLYMPPGSSKLIRAQGVLVVDDELKRVVDFCAGQAKAQFAVDIADRLSRDASLDEEEEVSEEDEELVEKSVEVIRQSKRASVSLLQRRLRIGYTRAARIMDILEERGIVGPGSGSEPREILVDLDVEVGADVEENGNSSGSR